MRLLAVGLQGKRAYNFDLAHKEFNLAMEDALPMRLLKRLLKVRTTPKESEETETTVVSR